jgi:hypothetical protein
MSGSTDNAILDVPTLPNDKIVGVYSGTFNAATDTTRITYTLASAPYYAWWYKIPHSFGQPVFTDLMTSTDGTTYSLSNSIAFSDFNFLYIYAGQSASSGGNPTGTIYYKLVASWINIYDLADGSSFQGVNLASYINTGTIYGNSPSVTPVLPNQITAFDSRLVYRKVINSQLAAVYNGADAAQTSVPTTAKLPIVKGYMECFQNQVWPCHSGGTGDTFLLDDSMETGYYIIQEPTAIFPKVTVDIRSDGSANGWSVKAHTLNGTQGNVRFWWKVLA